MGIEEMILVNQLAQGITDMSEGERWFCHLDLEAKRDALRNINFMIINASPRDEDAAKAIAISGLKPTFTPCVIASKPNVRQQLGRVTSLPENELLKGFKLLIAFLGFVDQRRRETKPLDIVNHWWHRDLRDASVVEEIRRQYYRGTL